MNPRPQRPQMNAETQCLQMNDRPQHSQMNFIPQRLQMNARPQRPQMNARPQLVGIFLFEDTTNLPKILLVRILPTMLGSTLSDTTSHAKIYPR